MHSQKKTFITAIVVGVIIAVVSQMTGQNIPKSCKTLREQMRQLVTNDSGFSGSIGGLPERLLNKVIGKRIANLSEKECEAKLPEITAGLEALSRTKWGPSMRQAADESDKAVKDCILQRKTGVIKTHVESAQCSNPKITAAFQQIGYPHMDLVNKFTALKLEMAQKDDKALTGESDDFTPYAEFFLDASEQERTRLAAEKK